MEKETYNSVEKYKNQHCNHKCIECDNRVIYAYEDDTPAGRTPYHWWEGKCDVLGIRITDNELPPESCPFKSKS